MGRFAHWDLGVPAGKHPSNNAAGLSFQGHPPTRKPNFALEPNAPRRHFDSNAPDMVVSASSDPPHAVVPARRRGAEHVAPVPDARGGNGRVRYCRRPPSGVQWSRHPPDVGAPASQAPGHDHHNCTCIGCGAGSAAVVPTFEGPTADFEVVTYYAESAPTSAESLPRSPPPFSRPYTTGPPRA